MYKRYVDNVTGEDTENSFIGNSWLTNERKVKLFYEGKYYDFYIKDVAENSATYLYTY
jgi:hypothetical protein